jgi:tetratricopeptide (TPR) repeat protein
MKKTWSILAACLLTAASSMTAWARPGYTYTYDYWGDVQYSPDAYRVVSVLTHVELGLERKLDSPEGLFVRGNRIYVCDTGNSRILEIERAATDRFAVKRVIEEFSGGSGVRTFSHPTDVCETDGFFYICDKGNNRILKLDGGLRYVAEFGKPTDATFDQSLSFLPEKLSVDAAGRVYCIAENVNKGLIKFEADGSFNGFIGASEVTYDFADYLWKKIATKEQLAAMESFVPTEYDNLYMDEEGFLYACTTNVSEANLRAGTAKPIRKLNLMGKDILIKNGDFEPIGDIQWGDGGGYSGPSLITDVTALNDTVYFGLDRVRGRIFAYDAQGNLLFAFGGGGNLDGYFKLPSALDHMGRDLLVLDAQDGSLTVFVPTEYGRHIYQAIEEYDQGRYLDSGETWREVLKRNGNYALAYVGIGKALARQEEYGEAMKYFRLAWDTDNYSKAFKYYRKEWVEEHIGLIFTGVFLLSAVPLGAGRIRKIRREIRRAGLK